MLRKEPEGTLPKTSEMKEVCSVTQGNSEPLLSLTMRLCVLIPTYKEYDNLKKLIPLLHEKIYLKLPNVQFSTLVVDANSPDRTKELIRQYSKKYKNLQVSYGENVGIGGAMKRGYLYVLEKLKVDAVATLEADYVVDPKELIPMIKKLKSFDVVLASRSNEKGYYGNGIRRFNHIIVNTIISTYLSGMNEVHEHTAACRVIKIEGVLDKIDIDALPNGYAFFPSILFSLSKVTKSFYEYQVPFYQRTTGESKMDLSKVRPLIKEMIDYLMNAVKCRFSTS